MFLSGEWIYICKQKLHLSKLFANPTSRQPRSTLKAINLLPNSFLLQHPSLPKWFSLYEKEQKVTTVVPL